MTPEQLTDVQVPTDMFRVTCAAITLAIATSVFAQPGRKTPIEDELESYTALKPAATNIQLNEDGSVRLVRLSKPSVNDQLLAHLQTFKKVDYLAIVCPAVTDAGIENVRGLSNLDTLVLSTTQITDRGLSNLSQLSKLERLYLDDTSITDEGLERLKPLRNLRTLSLANTRISDAGMQHVAQLTQLEVLILNDTSITDDALKQLGTIASLRSLQLVRTEIAGHGLKQLESLKQLEHLDLTETNVTDASLDFVSQLKDPPLKSLLLHRTATSIEGIIGLQRSLDVSKIFPRPPASRLSASADDATQTTAATTGVKLEVPPSHRFASTDEIPDFQRHVIPLLGRLGCNGRNCHGSFQGRGGFRLSMFGYDFEMDLENLTGGDYPRVDVGSTADSLILIKPTSEDDHEGGLRYKKGGWQYHLLRQWIERGAKGVSEDAADFVRLEITPDEIVFHEVGESVQLRAVAVWSDGSEEDVTCLTRFESKDDSVAEVSGDGLVRAAGKGDAHVISFYDNGVTATPVIVPRSDLTGDAYPPVETPTKIDELVVAKLAKLAIVPSELCSDQEFLRRVSLDVTGTLPTPEEISRFVADKDSAKRTKKIDELLDRPAHVTWWTLRLADLTGSNAGYLGATDMAPIVADQWNSWLARRIRENVGWDKIAKDILLASSRRPDQTYDDFTSEQSSYTRSNEPADFTDLDQTMPHYWFRDNQQIASDKALTFAYTFLGVRLDCAQCHKHPYDRWSKKDFEQFTEFFTRIKAGVSPEAQPRYDQLAEMLGVPVKLNTAALRRQSFRRIAAEGRPVPWKEIYIDPPDHQQQAKLLAGEEIDLNQYDDPRIPLTEWLTDPQNPLFAKAMVNRIWASYFNVGIVEPPDDLNLANPPSNKPLLEWLSAEFVAHGYDLKWLHKTITSSRTYQLSWKPNESNRRDERNFSHAIVRRLPAEVIVDAILQSTSNDKALSKAPYHVANRKIGQHPKSYQTRAIDFSLLVFGKPLRTTTCDCERKNNPTLLQALYIRNDSELLETLQRPDGWLVQVASQLALPLSSEVTGKAGFVPNRESASESPIEAEQINQLVRAAYLRTLSRLPRSAELEDCRIHLNESENTVEGLRDIMWSLLNTQEFITNH